MSNIIIIVSIIIAGFILLYIILKQRILKIINPSALVREIKKEIDQVIVELNRTTETNIGLLEDKINVISELLSKADKRILLLQRESEKLSLTRNYNQIIKQAEKKPVKEEVKVETKEKAEEETGGELDIRARVLGLYRNGFSKNIIANKLDLAVGEVELIISLEEAGNIELNAKK